MVDELKLPWDSPPPVPTTLAEALLTELPPTDFNRNLSRLNAAKLDKPPPYRSFLGTPFSAWIYALKGEPLARQPASKTDVVQSLLAP
jgi:hypothetical protein